MDDDDAWSSWWVSESAVREKLKELGIPWDEFAGFLMEGRAFVVDSKGVRRFLASDVARFFKQHM